MSEKHQAMIDAERACTEARENTPQAYQKYIIMLSQRKNVGTREKPRWITYELPYMAVDGRIAMFIDEHRAAGKRVDVITAFEQHGELTLCRADIGSEIYGSARGHAQVNIGGGGVDRTSPFENAETSAIGRALGFFAYGLFGSGIASADEVQAAHDAQVDWSKYDPYGKPLEPQEQAQTPKPKATPILASKAQISALLDFAERHSVTDHLGAELEARGLDIADLNRLELSTHKTLMDKMVALVRGERDNTPDYTEFENKAKAEAKAATQPAAVEKREKQALLAEIKGAREDYVIILEKFNAWVEENCGLKSLANASIDTLSAVRDHLYLYKSDALSVALGAKRPLDPEDVLFQLEMADDEATQKSEQKF